MRLLADTHVLLWALAEPERLQPAALEALRKGDNEVFVSVASAWEIAIKAALGRLPLPDAPAAFLPRALERTGFTVLPITLGHALAAGALPPHHHDPFDRMLVAQAAIEGLVIVSRDDRLAAYGAPVLPA